jgi:hypothetical protein
MSKKTAPPESDDRAAAGDEAAGEGSIERFNHLARRLLGVSNKRVQEERQREATEKKRPTKRK